MSISDLDSDLGNVVAQLGVLKDTLDAIVTKLQSTPSAPDLTAEIATVSQISDSIKALNTEGQDAVNPPPPPAPATPEEPPPPGT